MSEVLILCIIRNMCTMANVSREQLDAKMSDVIRYAEHVVDVKGDTLHLVLPGVVTLLNALHERRVPCALTTGNMAFLARLKLKCAGLESFSVDGAFGDEQEERADILRLAVKRCAPNVNMARVVHVGDATSDVRAVKENGAALLAVATGAYDKEVLRREEPAVLVDDLSDTTAVLSAMGFGS